jgi:hypothetical protein
VHQVQVVQRSEQAHEVMALCAQLYRMPRPDALDPIQQNAIVAALMVIEDATCAVEGYRALAPFRHVDEAYLAKYGLLQALQLGFDAAESVGSVFGLRARADAAPGGKAVKITRNIVAGHPIGGSMDGRAWMHYLDRQTARDHAVIRVMSFSRDDPQHWTGQTQLVEQLIADGLAVIAFLLNGALEASNEYWTNVRATSKVLPPQ